MAVTQLTDAIPDRNNDIVSAVASIAANTAQWTNPGDPPSHMDLLLAALQIDRRLDELWPGR